MQKKPRETEISIPRLPETADEAKSIAAILGGRSALYLREKAQERTVKTTDLSRARYLHFATHGFLGGEFLEVQAAQTRGKRGETGQPAIALTLVGNLQGEDGLLTMKEVIEDLELNAALVVLSACNTAGETTSALNGEGFAGLTRAFMYAGAKGLVVSHWSVESRSAQDLITELFRGLKSGKPPAAALAAAREKIAKGTLMTGNRAISTSHPYFWAPFVLVGD
jgi:CHAT domain-containing protein